MPGQQYPVLLVEDNLDDLLFIERAIEKGGFRISLNRVENGESAIQYLRGEGAYADRARHPIPALLITNIKMPRMSGFELLDWIKQQPEWQSLPVVVFSNAGEPGDIDRFADLGVKSYFAKPVNLNELIKILQKIMQLLPD